MKNESSNDELLHRAYDALCKKFNLKRIYVSFYAKGITKYKCCPYLKALTNDDCDVDFVTSKSAYAYVQSLPNVRTHVPECKTMDLLLELLASTSIYLYDASNGKQKLFLPKGTCLEEILIMSDCLLLC